MSKLGCECGHIIRDNGNPLAYRASVLPDVRHDDFFDWLARESQSYIDATRQDAVDGWLKERGYPDSYAALKLADGSILHDHIHSRYLSLVKDMYECEACGRIHVQGNKDVFDSFAPDSAAFNGVLDPDRGAAS